MICGFMPGLDRRAWYCTCHGITACQIRTPRDHAACGLGTPGHHACKLNVKHYSAVRFRRYQQGPASGRQVICQIACHLDYNLGRSRQNHKAAHAARVSPRGHSLISGYCHQGVYWNVLPLSVLMDAACLSALAGSRYVSVDSVASRRSLYPGLKDSRKVIWRKIHPCSSQSGSSTLISRPILCPLSCPVRYSIRTSSDS